MNEEVTEFARQGVVRFEHPPTRLFQYSFWYASEDYQPVPIRGVHMKARWLREFIVRTSYEAYPDTYNVVIFLARSKFYANWVWTLNNSHFAASSKAHHQTLCEWTKEWVKANDLGRKLVEMRIEDREEEFFRGVLHLRKSRYEKVKKGFRQT